jgi:hypothetical protein
MVVMVVPLLVSLPKKMILNVLINTLYYASPPLPEGDGIGERAISKKSKATLEFAEPLFIPVYWQRML